MQVFHAKPVDKGVTRLMYVGDDLQSRPMLNWPFLVTVGAALYLASFLFGEKRR